MTRFWLAFTTPPQREKAAEGDLRELGMRSYVPMVERSIVLRGKRRMVKAPALRGYVFVEFGQLDDQFEYRLHAAISSKYVNRVVGFNGHPGQITDCVFREFADRLAFVQQEPQFHLRAGSQVTIKKGPFAELPGIIQGIHGDSATVLVRLFRRSCETKIGLIQLEELATGHLEISSRQKRRLQGVRKSGNVHVG